MSLTFIANRCPGRLPTLEECAQHYAHQWSRLDHEPSSALRERGTEVEQLHALNEIVRRYKVARCLGLKYDVGRGLPRMAPLLDAVSECRGHGKRRPDAIRLVNDLDSHISQRYGGRRVTSLASKVAWFAFGSPVVIYDSLARDALGVRSTDYDKFFRAWREQYEANHTAIASAAAPFEDAEWFRERVFDILLWKVGDARRVARSEGKKINGGPSCRGSG